MSQPPYSGYPGPGQPPPAGYQGQPPPPPGYYPDPNQPPPGYYPTQSPPPQPAPLPPNNVPPKQENLTWRIVVLIIAWALIPLALIVMLIWNARVNDENARPAATPTLAPSPTQSFLQPTVATRPTVAPTSAATVIATVLPSSRGKIGQIVTQNGYLVTVNNIERNSSFSALSTAKAGNIFVAVDVTVASGKAKGVSSNLLYCSIKDSQGFKYAPTLAGKDPSLASQNDIAQNDKVRGWATFEVPQNATGLSFEYIPLSLDNTLISIDLN